MIKLFKIKYDYSKSDFDYSFYNNLTILFKQIGYTTTKLNNGIFYKKNVPVLTNRADALEIMRRGSIYTQKINNNIIISFKTRIEHLIFMSIIGGIFLTLVFFLFNPNCNIFKLLLTGLIIFLIIFVIGLIKINEKTKWIVKSSLPHYSPDF